jgi:hypothetical protein
MPRKRKNSFRVPSSMEIEKAMFPKRGIPKEDPFSGESIGSEKLKAKLRDVMGKMTLRDTLKLINRLREARGGVDLANYKSKY